MPAYKVTVTLPNGTLITYLTTTAVTETADGIITVHKDKIVDQKVEPI